MDCNFIIIIKWVTFKINYEYLVFFLTLEFELKRKLLRVTIQIMIQARCDWLWLRLIEHFLST
jgi:hypothetical protein